MKFASILSLALPLLASSHAQELDLVDTLIEENSAGGASEGLFDTTIAAVVALNLTDTLKSLDGVTVFAPEDSAWEALGLNETTVGLLDPTIATNVLLYHIVSGEYYADEVIASSSLTTLFDNQTFAVNGTLLTDGNGGVSDIVATDIQASNGIIHTIDNILVPADLVTTTINVNTDGPYKGFFDTLIAAVSSAGLLDLLRFPEGPYTVFAPTDDAFAALGFSAESIATLNVTSLQTILSAHVVPGYYTAEDLIAMGTVDTLVPDVSIYANGGEFEDNDNMPFNVLVPDVKTVNGVIHAIDTVINTGVLSG